MFLGKNEISEYNILSPTSMKCLTPIKSYTKIKNEGRGELVFSSPPYNATTPTRQIAKDLIEIPSPITMRKRNIMTDFDSPIKKKLMTLLINKSNKLHSKVSIISKMRKKSILFKTQNNITTFSKFA